MGLRPSGLDSTHPIAICMLGGPEAKSREVAISDVLLPDCSRFTGQLDGTLKPRKGRKRSYNADSPDAIPITTGINTIRERLSRIV